jgi:hypothetical protein
MASRRVEHEPPTWSGGASAVTDSPSRARPHRGPPPCNARPPGGAPHSRESRRCGQASPALIEAVSSQATPLSFTHLWSPTASSSSMLALVVGGPPVGAWVGMVANPRPAFGPVTDGSSIGPGDDVPVIEPVSSEPTLLVLHAVRLLGFADEGRVAARFALDRGECWSPLRTSRRSAGAAVPVRRHGRVVVDRRWSGAELRPPCGRARRHRCQACRGRRP